MRHASHATDPAPRRTPVRVGARSALAPSPRERVTATPPTEEARPERRMRGEREKHSTPDNRHHPCALIPDPAPGCVTLLRDRLAPADLRSGVRRDQGDDPACAPLVEVSVKDTHLGDPQRVVASAPMVAVTIVGERVLVPVTWGVAFSSKQQGRALRAGALRPFARARHRRGWSATRAERALRCARRPHHPVAIPERCWMTGVRIVSVGDGMTAEVALDSDV
ncbi:hypothetical protein QE375_003756 [Microbacterium foliorum]|uniref:Uncharacterized protein n=1 Tax=Microbacterium foliorum TaxID=104336 RepID=A0ABU1HVW8_9MICO|nr:hypothetical protein [Microbacterium foliorum]